MENYLIDTNILIDQFRKVRKAYDFILLYKPSLSLTSVAELIQGAKDKNDLRSITKTVSKLLVFPIKENYSKSAIALMQEFFLSHNLQFMDSLIAATALEENLTLVTSNTKHFSFIKGLKLLDWKKV